MVYEQMVAALQHGYYPIVMPDEATSEGTPYFTVRLFNDDGTVTPGAAPLFNPSPHLRACALIGYAVGAHRAWHARQAT